MKKSLKFIVLPIMLLSCALMVSACQKPEDKVAIHTPFKTVYYVGDELDVTGGILNYTKDGTTTQVVITSSMITGFTSATAGTFNMVIYYDGLSVVVPYTVNSIPELNLDLNKLYRSEYQESENSYMYAKFIASNRIGMFFSSTQFTSANPPTFEHSQEQFVISSTKFENGNWVVNSVVDSTTIKITIISENMINVYISIGVNTLNINLYAC